MATSRKQSSVLLVEFLDGSGNTAFNWRLDDPKPSVTRADVVTATNGAFSLTNTCGFDLLRSSSSDVAAALGKTQIIDTVVTTTDIT